MEIRVEMTLVENGNGPLKAYCTLMLNQSFVVKDVRLIETPKGLTVAMPSRWRTKRCERCHEKNSVVSRYCNQCGVALTQLPPSETSRGRIDLIHPVSPEARQKIENTVIQHYHKLTG